MDAMPGDAPQPGETPRDESNPWRFSDPDTAYWRALAEPDEARDKQDAFAAGHEDTAAELAGHQNEDLKFNPISEYATTTPESSTLEPAVPSSTAAEVPGQNRPTVALDRGPRPTLPPRLPRYGQGQPRPPSPLLDTSPFWLTDEQRIERAATGPSAAETRERQASAETIRRRRLGPQGPVTGLAAAITLGLVAAFFAWVSVEPFWLAFGHGDKGIATVTQCTGKGVAQRCAGQFRAADGGYAVTRVTLLGVEEAQRAPGAIAPARMVNMTSHRAYVGQAGLLLQVRWVLGFLLVLLCGLGIAAFTGARRLDSARGRRVAVIMSLAGPAVLLAGFLSASY